MVVTKFIQKNKIHASQWRKQISSSVNIFKSKFKIGGKDDKTGEENKGIIRFPDEIDILLTLDHPNIIKVLDVHDNDNYFQMVMEHHGKMDLFEFIDIRHRLVTKMIRLLIVLIDVNFTTNMFFLSYNF